VPDNYYDTLRERLARTEKLHINEDLERIKELRILVDFDEGGYNLDPIHVIHELLHSFLGGVGTYVDYSATFSTAKVTSTITSSTGQS
jgi:4-hydroxyphenylpyruvate dioxygenase-like putative hemolysin